MDSTRINVEACQWVSRLDRGLLPHEQRTYEAWLASDSRCRGAMLRAQAGFAILDRGRALGATAEPPPDRGWDRRFFLKLGGGSLAAMLCASLGLRMWLAQPGITTSMGEVRRMPLADGSIAVVNSGSHLRVRMAEDRRDVELADGEVWFEVAKDRHRPFTVSSGAARIQAVGTAFDVRRHPDHVEVLVTEGQVRVWSGGAEGGAVLVQTGSRALLDGDGRITIADLSGQRSADRLAWREGRIVLDGMTLGDAAAEFDRYHDRKLVIAPELSGKEMVGWFRTDDLDGFIRAATVMLGAEATDDGQVVRIAPRRGDARMPDGNAS